MLPARAHPRASEITEWARPRQPRQSSSPRPGAWSGGPLSRFWTLLLSDFLFGGLERTSVLPTSEIRADDLAATRVGSWHHGEIVWEGELESQEPAWPEHQV